MRRYGLVDIPDQASDIDAVPITRTITINGVTYDLSSDRTWTVSGSGISIGGTITGGTTGSVLFINPTNTLAQDNANFFWDDTNNFLGIGTNTPLTALHLKTSVNTSPRGLIVEQTSNDTIAGSISIRKIKGTATVANGDNLAVYQAEGYDGTNYINGSRLRFVVDGTVATGSVPTGMQFLTGSSGGGTERARFTSAGNLLINKTTDNGAKLQVLGQADFGDISSLTGVIAYQSAISTRLAVLNGFIRHTNMADVNLYIDTGGTGFTGNQPVRIYTEPFASVSIQFPLCIQGSGRETIFGQDTITTNPSSLVTMVSTTKGFLPPRMTSAQRTAIASPATGLIVYQTDGSAGLYVRNAAAWQLLGSGGGSGTVTSVSVVSANGFAGTVTNATTTPAITLSTTITGMLKGNGTAISAASAGTDFQAPITLTTTGTSGASTFASNTLNIPQYQGQLTLTTSGTSGAATLVGNTLNIPNYTTSGGTTQGVYTPTLGTTSNCTSFTIPQMQYFTVGNMVHVSGRITFRPTTTTNTFSFYLSVPVNQDFTAADYLCGGTCVRFLPSTTAAVSAGSIQGGGVNQVLFYFAVQNNTTLADWYFTFSYLVTGL